MRDIIHKMWGFHNRNIKCGDIIRGLGLLRSAGELWLIQENKNPVKLKAEDIMLDFDGIKAGDAFFDFDSMEELSAFQSYPSVCWESDNEKVLFAPANPSDLDYVISEMNGFIEKWWADYIYINDLQKSLSSIEDQEGKIFVTKDPSTDQLGPDSEVNFQGHKIILKEVTWIEQDEDGDGNRYLHIVLENGTYRRICFGDLSR